MRMPWTLLVVLSWTGALPSVAYEIPEEGLISHWKLEKDGTDSWGPNHCQPKGDLTFEAGVDGFALRLDQNVTEFYQLYPPHTLNFTGASTATYLAWVQTIADCGPNQGRFFEQISSPCSDVLLDLHYNHARFLYEVGECDYDQPHGGPHQLNDGQWHLVVGVMNGTQALVYADGALMREAAQTGVIHEGGWFRLGTPTFSGLLDEVAVYDRALTAAEIRAIYDSAGVRCDIYADLMPAPVAKRGETFTYRAMAYNDCTPDRTLDRATMTIHGPASVKQVLYDGAPITLGMESSVGAEVSMFVPRTAPIGSYRLTLAVYRGRLLLDEDIRWVEVE